MKVAERVLDVENNMTGEEIAMSVDQNSLAHIMDVLTKLYSDAELAVIREYSTNALDAHIQAGITRPIEVTLPGQLSPFFKVKDYGLGLDADDIREIYSRYGTSTKRNSNTVVGMLGLGCKSALAYTDQFTLIGVKDGMMTQVAISRNEQGAGSMTIVSQEQTTEPNGVEVIVPTKRGHEFASKCEQFFQVWQPGTVLVDGEQPAFIEGLWIEDGKYMMSEAVTEDTIIMGNVPYPMVEPDRDGAARRADGRRYIDGRGWVSNHLVAFVDIGEVAFVPSREALNWNSQTKAAVKRVRDDAQAKLDASFLAQIAAAASPAEAIETYRKAVTAGLSDKGQNDAKYQGRKVVTKFNRTEKDGTPVKHANMDANNSYLVSQWRNTYRYRGRKSGERTCQVGFDNISVWFTGFTGAILSPYKREKLAIFFENEGLTYKNHGDEDKRPETVVFVNELTDDEKFWITGAKVYDWSKVEAIKIKRDTTRVRDDGRPKGSYPGRKDGQWRQDILAADIDTSKPLLWKAGSGAQNSNHIPADATIICLASNRVTKFKRDFPQAIYLDDFINAKVKEWIDAIPKEDIIAYKVQANSGSIVRGLDVKDVDDPKLKEAITLAKKNVETLRSKMKECRYNWQHEQMLKVRIDAVKVDFHPNLTYPLLDGFSYGFEPKQKKHIIIYLNAAYKVQQAAAKAARKEA